jgi:hypothetical protein
MVYGLRYTVQGRIKKLKAEGSKLKAEGATAHGGIRLRLRNEAEGSKLKANWAQG